jgi:hypothetical protein
LGVFFSSSGSSSAGCSFAVILAMAIWLASSASWSCSIVSDEAPNLWFRWPASWWRSFSPFGRLLRNRLPVA